MRLARIKSLANPFRWRARYVLWVTWLALIPAIIWVADMIVVQHEMEAKFKEIREEFDRDEKVLRKEGRDFADRFFEDLQEGRRDEAWSKFSTTAQKKPEIKQDLETILKYLSDKPKLTRPKVTFQTGMCGFSYWNGVNSASAPKVFFSFHNAQNIEVPFFIDFTVGVEDGAARIESCSCMAIFIRARFEENSQ